MTIVGSQNSLYSQHLPIVVRPLRESGVRILDRSIDRTETTDPHRGIGMHLQGRS
jgi:hypothetical protein